LCNKTAAISSAAFAEELLFSKFNCSKVETVCNPYANLITPEAFKLFPLRLGAVKIVLCDRTTAISSAASSVILLQLIYSLVSDEICCKALATLITPSNCKFFHED